MTTTYSIRPAHHGDLAAIVDIYNTIIAEGGFTADLHPYSVEAKEEWFTVLQNNSNIFVISNMDRIMGFFYFSPWRENREALRNTAEISFYLKKEFRGQGLGTRILSKALKLADEKKLKFLLAILLDTNTSSIALLEKFNFEIAGHLEQIAEINGDQCGQYIMLRKVN